MLNFTRRPEEPKDLPKPGLRPAIYDPPGAPRPPPPATGNAAAPPAQPAPPPATGAIAPAEPVPTDAQGSRLAVGINIKLKGVEISDCDILHIEGQVEATVHSKAMQIAKPGTLKGTALIDTAEIHGEFVGELTARTRLVVHATGRVSGTIRYGKLIVAEGGEINGDLKRIDAPDGPPPPAGDARLALRPSRETS
jgi:cytoskeletal protein CcmA (bactofilin family)